jgi:hypothetical protein
MKGVIFWDVTQCSPVKSSDISEECTVSIFRVSEAGGKQNPTCNTLLASLLLALLLDPGNGGGRFLRNVGQLLLDYTTLHPGRQESSYTLILYIVFAPVIFRRGLFPQNQRLPGEVSLEGKIQLNFARSQN